ncbi:MAG: hypothetical protein P4L50_28765 [Anaerolineaceae bacterium]|nr:hypothetical protein [Anaerolineaceae bacterium]
MNIKARTIIYLFIIAAALNTGLASCASVPSAVPPAAPTAAQAAAITPLPKHTAAAAVTATAVPAATNQPAGVLAVDSGTLTGLALNKGDYYFSQGGQQSLIFSRNLTGIQQSDFDTILDWTKIGGSRLVRIQLDSLGLGYSSTGAVDEAWAQKWEQVFDKANADGIDMLLVFSGWFDWNNGSPNYGYSTWGSNAMNAANGGPAKTPAELFKNGSITQKQWLGWIKSLVMRWQGRKNIAAWEIFSEVNLATGATEGTGTALVEQAAAVIRAADAGSRPVTASLADVGGWMNFYRSSAIDFINVHPYPGNGELDTSILAEVRPILARYHKPVLIGESGLSSAAPSAVKPNLTTAANAKLGIEHAIWAGVVSGAMNGRGLYWEDSFAIYFQDFGMPFVQSYASAELAAANFVKGVDFSGFKPVAVDLSGGRLLKGAALGSDKFVIGWFRDSQCEPPNWNLRPVISKQVVKISAPGSAKDWQVDFYDAATGKDITSSTSVTRTGGQIILALPDFKDEVAFKMYLK